MELNRLVSKCLIFGITTLLIISSFFQMTVGYNIETSNRDIAFENYDSYHLSERSNYEYHPASREYTIYYNIELKEEINPKRVIQQLDGPMDSPWPMKCHDTHHTSRSPYGTANNSYYELWQYKFDNRVDTDPAIGNDGTIYVGGSYTDMTFCMVAINPDGSLRWRYRTDDLIWNMCPAIAEDGTIYVGSWDYYLHAVNSNGTRKWRFDAGGEIVSDPVVGKDGTIYFGVMGPGWKKGRIYAVNPNGTEQWYYDTGYWIVSDPAIGDDETIYIGSSDDYLYAMYPNGTLRWRFKTGAWIQGPPSIANDGTIYIGSFDGYLYAMYPNGTLHWKTKIWYGSNTNPSIGLDGAIYVCSSNKLFAINPNGSIKWKFNLGGSVGKSSPAICADGIIYIGIEIGDRKGGEVVAMNPDGTEHWRKRLSNLWIDSSPCIGEDGTVYIISTNGDYSVLHAFGAGGELDSDANGPYYGLLNMPVEFSGSASYGYPPYTWFWDFGDSNTSNEQNPTHVYKNPSNYTIILTITDNKNNTSEDTTWAWIQESNNPPYKPSIDGVENGKAGNKYDYNFTTNDPEGANVWYYIEWGDGANTGWFGPHTSGKKINESHSWTKEDTYTIRGKAKDPYGVESEWGELKVTMPKNKQTSKNLILRFSVSYAYAFSILRILYGDYKPFFNSLK